MKFNEFKFKKTICVLASSIIILTMSGCTKEYKIQKPVVENSNIKEVTDKENLEYTENSEIEYTNTDMTIINEFNKLEKKIDEILSSQAVSSLKDTAKEIFITSVDFIFYNGKINGITFDELSNKGKEKVLNIVFSIDSKIEDEFPGYKNTISSKTNDILTKASELIQKGKNNIKDFSKELLKDKYDDFIQAKNEIINSTKESLNGIIEYGKEAYEKGKEYLKEWYEEFKK